MAEKKTALITGASEGIGYELSRIFAGEGYDLVLVARNEEKLNRVSEELARRWGVSCTVIPKDLSKSSAPQEIYDEVSRGGSKVDVLVNNAGYTIYGAYAETDITSELDLLQVLVIAPMMLTKLFLKDMLEAGGGKILNIGSTGSFVPCPCEAVYGASKAFVLYFSEAIAEELAGTGVSVTTLCPGATGTQFFSRSGTDRLKVSRLKMSAEDVARIGFEALMAGKGYVVPGTMNKAMVFSTRISPRRLVAKVTKRFLS